MKTISNILFFTLFLLFIQLCGTASAQPVEGDLSLGSIRFPTSVSGEAQSQFLTGVLALHSFWYPQARDHFRRARELDPRFAMTYWGEAMTHDHPIWGQHEQAAGAAVLAALDKQQNLKWDSREQGFIEAVRILYDSNQPMNERRRQYAEAMQALSRSYPDDDEVLAFSALADMSAPSFNYGNPDVEDVVPIAARLEDLYQRNPSHPGAMHYLIHVYDSEKFARMGLRPADDYAGVAYSSSHAIHMPSHIYKHLEMWDKVIKSNIAAWQASVEWQQRTGRPLSERDYHSYRWLFEAYLEVGNYQKACGIIKNMRRIQARARKENPDPGRIPEVLQNFERQYEDASKRDAPACAGRS